MKTISILYITLLIFGAKAQFPRSLQSSKNSYDYSSYSATSTNQNLSSQTLSSKTSDQSVVYITNSGVTINNSNLNKESGDSSKTENSEFYGVNAAVLVNGGGLTMTGGTITTKAKGANAIVATNNGSVKISGTEITSTASGSARGLHSTFGGKIEATNVKITTKGVFWIKPARWGGGNCIQKQLEKERAESQGGDRKKSVQGIVDMLHCCPNTFTPPRLMESQMVYRQFPSSRMSWSEGVREGAAG